MKLFPWPFFLFFFGQTLVAVEISFIAVDIVHNEVMIAKGPSLDHRVTPCSTFKIALSLMGYEEGFLQNEQEPRWPYDGSPTDIQSHKMTHSWKSLIHSCQSMFVKSV